jgi:hypothetical protein
MDRITSTKIKKYKTITKKALAITKNSVIKGKEADAQEIFDMVENYLSDAEHFEKKQDLVNAFAAINYAHGWIDAGVRLNVFDVNDRKLFTIK